MTPENKVRAPVLKFAKRSGIGHIRLAFRRGATSGWPDDLFLFSRGRAVFIEFKRLGKKPTPLQQHKLETARELGFTAEWFDNSDAARAFLASILDFSPVHGAGLRAP